MKKIVISIIIVLLFSIAYISNNTPVTVKDGTYVLAETKKKIIMSPHVTISKDDIFFSYDLLSSYLIVGDYTIEKDILTMTTKDGKYIYVFKIEGNQLIFKENKSSELKLFDEKSGVKITNNSAFELVDK